MPRVNRLTPREKQIIELKANGCVDKQVAIALNISYRTVRTHIDRVKFKFNASSFVELIVILSEAGIVKTK